jgi:tetratricopeptide (TPR) repeat protein
MNPAGYHATSVLLHAMTAVIFFFVVRRLLAAAIPATERRRIVIGALFAALAFSVHPLRAESVAWVTERRDIVSGLFYIAALLAYLKMADRGSRRSAWLVVSVVVYALAIASKVVAVTLPLVLIVLDVYPLRRLPATPSAWLSRGARRVLLEKVPWAAIALIGGGASTLAMRHAGYITSVDTLGIGARLLMAAHSVVFYLRKTIVPDGFSPLYERPAVIDWRDPRFAVSVVLVCAISAVLVAMRRRWPAGLATWAAYLALLVPVSGLVYSGAHHLAADRYSYLACLPWAVLFGGAVVAVLGLPAERISGLTRRATAGVAVLVLVGLGAFASLQTTVWHDSEALWRSAVEYDPHCALCHSQLGGELGNRRLLGPAIAHFERAVTLRPESSGMRRNLALALFQAGRLDGAIPHWRIVLDRHPGDVGAATRLADALLKRGRAGEAVAALEPAIRVEPGAATLRATLVRAYRAAGRADDAQAEIETLRRFDAGLADRLARE